MQATESDPSVRYQRREDRTMLLLMTPALLVIVVLLVVPLAWLSWQSICHDGFTLENYRRMFTGAYLDTFLLTFKLSMIVTVITLAARISGGVFRGVGAAEAQRADTRHGHPAVLDQRARAHLCVARAAAAHGRWSTRR